MYYVYILKSQKSQKHYYIGLTSDIEKRVTGHNASDSLYSKRYAPWKIETYVFFRNKRTAAKFERYLKHGSGFAFLKKHLLEPIN